MKNRWKWSAVVPANRGRIRVRDACCGLCGALLALAWPGAAFAGLHFSPYLSSQAAYDSNVFAVSSREQALAISGDPTRDDTILRNAGGVDTSYDWGLQKLRASAEGRRIDYEHFKQLNHNEYLLGAGYDWALGSTVDGLLDYRQERRMASFADRRTSELTLERDRVGRGTFNVMITPQWRLESGATTHTLVSPLPLFPEFSLDENSGSLAAKYLGFGNLTAGLYAEYLQGRYHGVPDANPFHQTTLDLTSSYGVKGLYDLSSKLGYTRRQGQAGGGGSVSGFTGSLAYARTLTGKTTAQVELFRRISSYVAGANSVTDTGATLGLSWQPTVKIHVATGYTWTQSRFQGQSAVGSADAGRSDDYQSMFLNLDYQALDWLSVQPFGRYQDRSSNMALNGFNEATVGLTLRARLNDAKTAVRGR